MVYKVVKISEDNYKWLLRESAQLQSQYGSKTSINDALNAIRSKKHASLLSLAGTLELSDKQAKDMQSSIVKKWSKWNSV